MSAEKIKLHLAKQFHLPDEQIEKLLPDFISTLAAHMENLQAAIDAGDPAVIGKAGHKIKGAFLNLGLSGCAQIAQTIEENGKSGETSIDYQQLTAELRSKTEPFIKK